MRTVNIEGRWKCDFGGAGSFPPSQADHDREDHNESADTEGYDQSDDDTSFRGSDSVRIAVTE